MTKSLFPKPKSRALRIFPFDPSIGGGVDSDGLSEITIEIPWEEELKPGPVGEYLEVVDADPASRKFYRPVDLNDPYVLAQNGLSPVESNPQFHQQMVYAVAMATIGHFERALGREALWSDRLERDKDGRVTKDLFVPRLRIYPHALRDRNAYFSPDKKAILFGYFQDSGRGMPPGTTVYTCLSHDIIAHEVAHALLDGVHPRFNEPMNEDVLAFHEGFADIVAIFQRFAYPGVLRHQIARTRGNLGNQNMLAQLAQQFGRATGRSTALRDALGETDPSGDWKPRHPSPDALRGITEPHARGAIFVAAVFGAFMKVYRTRTADLFRLASGGTGVLDDGDIHPDLTGRLTEEAADCARTVLRMCIRAIDYCPPVGINFGDYLRALITADYDESPIEGRPYRLAFNESFREWGIFPRERRGLAVEALFWPTGLEVFEEKVSTDEGTHKANRPIDDQYDQLKSVFERKIRTPRARRRSQEDVVSQFDRTNVDESGGADDAEDFAPAKEDEEEAVISFATLVGKSRSDRWAKSEEAAALLHERLHRTKKVRNAILHMGIVIKADPNLQTIYRNRYDERFHSVEIHAVRVATRLGDRGWAVPDLVVEITQRRRGYFDDKEQKERDEDGKFGKKPHGDFKFRAGCTLLVNPATYEIRRVIRSAGAIDDDEALGQMRWYLMRGAEPPNAFASPSLIATAREPFALLHRHYGG